MEMGYCKGGNLNRLELCTYFVSLGSLPAQGCQFPSSLSFVHIPFVFPLSFTLFNYLLVDCQTGMGLAEKACKKAAVTIAIGATCCRINTTDN